jgi:hypothetical protein
VRSQISIGGHKIVNSLIFTILRQHLPLLVIIGKILESTRNCVNVKVLVS